MSAPPIGNTNSAEREAGAHQGRVHELLAPIDDRPALDQLLQLRKRDERAGERDRADQGGEQDREGNVAVDPARNRRELVELRQRDQRGCAAADAVKQRHHLRHRGHLYATRGDRSERAADQRADHHQPRDVDARFEQRRDDRDDNADGADLVAASRGRR
jgi:hypothetical protein